MFMVAALAIGLGVVPLARGRLGNLARVRLRMTWAILLATALQVLIIEIIPRADERFLDTLHVLSYAVAAIFVVANRRLFGIGVMAVGAGLNALVIAANGGTMPADPDALARSGWVVDPGQFENSAPISHARLAFLGDIFALPRWLPLANVFSIGDVLIMVGGIVLVHWICDSRLIPAAIRTRYRPPLKPGAGEPPPPEVAEAGPGRRNVP